MGITRKQDIDQRMKYKEIQKAPDDVPDNVVSKIHVDIHKQKQREVKVRGR